MVRTKVLIQQIISPHGNITAMAQSVAIASGDRGSKMSQTVTATVASHHQMSHCSASSYASSTQTESSK